MLVTFPDHFDSANSCKRRNIALLGSTGSIGNSCLQIVRHHPDNFRVFCLAANTSWKKLHQQILEFEPDIAIMGCEKAYLKLKESLPDSCRTKLLCGSSELNQVVSSSDIDVVVAAIVGTAGLESTIAAVKAGKMIALANKESIVVAGNLLK